MNYISTALIAVAAVGFILYRQTTERPIKDNPVKLPMILGIIGVIETADYLKSGPHLTAGAITAVLLGFVVAVAIAVPRAHSMRIYRNTSGIMVRKGTAVTVVLWFAAIAAHVALSIGVPVVFGEGVGHGLSGLDGATLLIYLAVSLGVQGLIAKSRVAAIC